MGHGPTYTPYTAAVHGRTPDWLSASALRSDRRADQAIGIIDRRADQIDMSTGTSQITALCAPQVLLLVLLIAVPLSGWRLSKGAAFALIAVYCAFQVRHGCFRIG